MAPGHSSPQLYRHRVDIGLLKLDARFSPEKQHKKTQRPQDYPPPYVPIPDPPSLTPRSPTIYRFRFSLVFFLAPQHPCPKRRTQMQPVPKLPNAETHKECTRSLVEVVLYINYSRASTPGKKEKEIEGRCPTRLIKPNANPPTPPCQWLMQSLPNVPRPPLRSVSRNECISAWVSRVFFFSS